MNIILNHRFFFLRWTLYCIFLCVLASFHQESLGIFKWMGIAPNSSFFLRNEGKPAAKSRKMSGGE